MMSSEQHWNKLKLVYNVDGNFFWNKSHAQVPTPVLIEDLGLIRVFYGSRDQYNKSRISFVDLKTSDLTKVEYVHDQPVLSMGKVGTFDDCGVVPSWVVKHDSRIFLYYIGYNVRTNVPYYNSIGLAISDDLGITFKKVSDGPLWDRNIREPYFSASSCIIKDNDRWKIWYLSCTEYREIDSLTEPRYHLKYATSNDGIHWNREGTVAIDYKSESEAGIARPSVLIEGDVYHMWYSYRNFGDYKTNMADSYKVGYARSKDGINWERMDQCVQLPQQEDAWDSIMKAYPGVIDIHGRRLMFYNGNGFGKSGFGIAELLND